MQSRLLEVLVCPKCLVELALENPQAGDEDEIDSGTLSCTRCAAVYPIVNGIPRFVTSENYASSFGYQWNLFRAEQIDSINGLQHSRERFYTESDWSPEWMKGKWILDAGCGAGRFLDVVSTAGAEVVGIDISNAVDAAKENLKGRKNVHFVQASIYELPFRTGSMDGCYCIGVIQHTPDPEKSVKSLPRVLKEGGRLLVTIYPRNRWTMLYSKYWVRPITRRMDQRVLLKTIQGVMPVVFPVTEVLFRLPVLGRVFMFMIPVANYVNIKELSRDQRYRWALLDTFDMLSPQYDSPQRQQDVEAYLAETGIEDVRRTTRYALSLVGRKAAAAASGSHG